MFHKHYVNYEPFLHTGGYVSVLAGYARGEDDEGWVGFFVGGAVHDFGEEGVFGLGEVRVVGEFLFDEAELLGFIWGEGFFKFHGVLLG